MATPCTAGTAGCDGASVTKWNVDAAVRILGAHSSCNVHVTVACRCIKRVCESNAALAVSIVKTDALSHLLRWLQRVDLARHMLLEVLGAVLGLATFTLEQCPWPDAICAALAKQACLLAKVHAEDDAIASCASGLIFEIYKSKGDESMLAGPPEVEAMLAALSGRACREDANTFRFAALAVAGYCTNFTSAKRFLAAGAAAPLLAGLRRFLADENATFAACWALQLIFMRGEGPKPFITVPDTLRLVLSAAKRHKGNRQICFDVGNVLLVAVQQPGGPAAALSAGAIEVLVPALVAFPEPEITFFTAVVLKFILGLSGGEPRGLAERIIRAGAVEAILNGLPSTLAVETGEYWEECLTALLLISGKKPEGVGDDVLISAAGAAALTKCGRRSIDSADAPSLMARVLTIMMHFSKRRESAKNLLDAGAVPLVVTVGRRFAKARWASMEGNTCFVAICCLGNIAAGLATGHDVFVRLGCVELACTSLRAAANDALRDRASPRSRASSAGDCTDELSEAKEGMQALACCKLLTGVLRHAPQAVAARMAAAEGVAAALATMLKLLPFHEELTLFLPDLMLAMCTVSDAVPAASAGSGAAGAAGSPGGGAAGAIGGAGAGRKAGAAPAPNAGLGAPGSGLAAAGSPRIAEQMLEAGAAPALVSALQFAASRLRSLGCGPDCAHCSAVRHASSRMQAARSIIRTICAVQKLLPLDARLLTADAGEAIMAAVRRFEAEDSIVVAAVEAFAALSLQAGSFARLHRGGAAKLLSLSVAAEHAEQFDLHMLLLLRNLAAEPPCRPVLMRLGSPALIISSMRRSNSSTEVAAAGCAAIRNLAISPENRLPLVAAGCGDAVLRAIAASTSRDVGWAACGALLALACEPANCKVLLNLDSEVAGAAAAATRMVECSPADARLSWVACGLILKMAAVDEVTDHMVQRDGVAGTLVDCLQHHAGDARVVRAACAAATRLAAKPINRGILVATGAREAVAAVIKACKPGSAAAVKAAAAAAALESPT